MDHDIDRLAAKIKSLVAEIDKYAGDDRWNVLLELIYKKGWTTPAEYRLVDGVVEHLTQQLRTVETLQNTLFEGSRLVLQKEGIKR
jgi:hypothetical protein